jgi:hypothetical protein
MFWPLYINTVVQKDIRCKKGHKKVWQRLSDITNKSGQKKYEKVKICNHFGMQKRLTQRILDHTK